MTKADLVAWFIRPDGKLRAGFRALAFILLFAGLMSVWLLFLPTYEQYRQALVPPHMGFLLVLLPLPWVATTVGLTLGMLKSIDKRPFAATGLALHSRWRRDLLLGLLMGGVLMSIPPVVLLTTGQASVGLGSQSAYAVFVGTSLYILGTLIVALNEELLFRGYFFQLLIEAMGPWGSTLCCSLLFGIMHLSNPNGTVWGSIGTGMWGIILSYAYIKTRSLWLPIGMHWSANFVEGVVWGMPVSGQQTDVSLLTTELRGHVLLTGGEFGPEGGILTPVALALGLGLLVLSRSFAKTREMDELYSRYVRNVAPPPPSST